jgi:endonuclease/exonuclease/phosphatase family metal-dependent hydrolase
VAAQAHALAAREPDVVALQEVTERSWPLWRAALEVIGLPHAACSLTGADPARQPAARRRGGVLIAAREPLSLADPLPVPRPESTVAARVAGVEVHTAHVPNAANGWTKPDTLRALREGLEARTGPAVLCGDLNTPRREHPDGTVISFARDSRERLREERGTEWDEGELCVVPGLAEIGWTDCFRTLHGYAAKEPSWTYPRGGGGYRLDHVFCSPELEPRACAYHHDWREAALSDHSALEADLERLT